MNDKLYICLYTLNLLNVLLHLTAVDQQSNIREFSCDIDQLELGFDVLNQIVAHGDRLIWARLIDKLDIIALPIEAFDGDSVLEPIRALEREWKSILTQPSPSIKKHRTGLLELTNQRLVACEHKIVQSGLLLRSMESLLVESQKFDLPPARKQVLESRHQRTVDFFQSQLDMAHISRLRLLRTIDCLQ